MQLVHSSDRPICMVTFIKYSSESSRYDNLAYTMVRTVGTVLLKKMKSVSNQLTCKRQAVVHAHQWSEQQQEVGEFGSVPSNNFFYLPAPCAHRAGGHNTRDVWTLTLIFTHDTSPEN